VLKAAVEGRLTEEWREENPDAESGSALLERILEDRRAKWEEAQLARYAAKEQNPPKNWRSKYKEPPASDTAGLPELPEGWIYVPTQPLLSPSKDGMKTGPFGSLLKKHEHQKEGVPVLGIENIGRMRFIPGTKIHVTAEKANQLEKYDARPGDVLISRSGTVGEVCIVPESLGEARISTNLMRVRLLPAGILPRYFALLFNAPAIVLNQVRELCRGSSRDFLNQDILSSIVSPLPPLAEQEEIIAEVERRLSVVEEVEAQVEAGLKRAARLRQSTLKQAFEGRLVSQDPSDEPASVLLERIREERAAQEEPRKNPRQRKRADSSAGRTSTNGGSQPGLF
jgi:type I restriction enzyme S subunit